MTGTATGSTRSTERALAVAGRDRARDPRAAVAAPPTVAGASSARRCSRSGATPTTACMCPVSMTYAAIPALRESAPELAAEWEPRLTLPDYDAGALAGMAMTERQGGSDVRANITRRRSRPGGSASYELHGHKWFCSHPLCDVFLVLAQAPGRPVVLPGRRDTRAAMAVPAAQGQARNAVAALERGRVPRRRRRGMVGEEGRGVPAHHPRWSTTRGSTALLGARGDHAAPRHGRGDPPRAPSPRRSERCWSISRRCATCWPTWRSNTEAATVADDAGRARV